MFQDFSLLGTWNFTTTLINNNVLHVPDTLLSENLSVYLSSSCLRGDVNLWFFSFLGIKSALIQNAHFLSSIAFVPRKEGLTPLFSRTHGPYDLPLCTGWGLRECVKASHRLCGDTDHTFAFSRLFNSCRIIGEAGSRDPYTYTLCDNEARNLQAKANHRCGHFWEPQIKSRLPAFAVAAASTCASILLRSLEVWGYPGSLLRILNHCKHSVDWVLWTSAGSLGKNSLPSWLRLAAGSLSLWLQDRGPWFAAGCWMQTPPWAPCQVRLPAQPFLQG